MMRNSHQSAPLSALRELERGTLEQARRTLISLIKARHRDRYAALLSRALTTEAQTLVRSVFGSFAYWQRNTGKRSRKYGEKTGKTYHDAIERFIGDLLRAKGDNRSSGRIFHATSYCQMLVTGGIRRRRFEVAI
jgi:hypothetical protein